MPQDSPRPSLQPLDGTAIDPLDGTLYEGVPSHLIIALQTWLAEFLVGSPRLADRVVLRLRYDMAASPWNSAADVLENADGMHLLQMINAALQLDDALSIELATEGYAEDPSYAAAAASYNIPAWLGGDGWGWGSHCTRGPKVDQLEQVLDDAGSAYTINWRIPVQLTRRVDPTIVAAAKEAMAADPDAGELLADAWRKVYGLEADHDPDAAYDDAVRAVEQIACGYVLPDDSTATLGKVIRHFQQGAHKWQFVLVGHDGDGDIGPITEAMNRLWVGQIGRHGGTGRRSHTVDEARAAVHLASFLIQMLASKAVSRRTP